MDLDGVLIHPRGYRAAVRASMEYLLERMGLCIPPPEDEIPALFEAQGVTSEWDMVSILLGLLVNAISAHLDRPLPALGLEQVLDWAAGQDTRGFAIDYATAVRGLAGLVPPGGLPAAAYRSAVENRTHPLHFDRLDHQPLVGELFNPARDVQTHLPTRLVQNYVLGHQVFEQTYQLPALDESASLLSELDRPALEPDLSAELLERWRRGNLGLAAFTARPSLPPRDAPLPLPGYSPEAEMALRLVGLEEIPTLGYGRLQWLAGQVGGYPDQYLKPAPEQPLSAAYAALTGREAGALLWAFRAARGEPAALDHPFPAEIDLHIFEDSSIGLLGGENAARILAGLGLRVALHRWGITQVPEKEASLLAAGAERIFAGVNQALRAVLARI